MPLDYIYYQYRRYCKYGDDLQFLQFVGAKWAMKKATEAGDAEALAPLNASDVLEVDVVRESTICLSP